MAIFFMRWGKTVSRAAKKGSGSTLERAAYCDRANYTDPRTGKTYFYRRPHEPAENYISLPAQTPAGEISTHELWEKVELREVAKNGMTARTLIIALPLETTREENAKMIKKLQKEISCRYGFGVSATIHYDKGNPHTHIMITTRAMNPDGSWIKQKPRIFNNKATSSAESKYLRHFWAQTENEVLAKYGLSVDPRPNKEKGKARNKRPEGFYYYWIKREAENLEAGRQPDPLAPARVTAKAQKIVAEKQLARLEAELEKDEAGTMDQQNKIPGMAGLAALAKRMKNYGQSDTGRVGIHEGTNGTGQSGREANGNGSGPKRDDGQNPQTGRENTIRNFPGLDQSRADDRKRTDPRGRGRNFQNPEQNRGSTLQHNKWETARAQPGATGINGTSGEAGGDNRRKPIGKATQLLAKLNSISELAENYERLLDVATVRGYYHGRGQQQAQQAQPNPLRQG